MSYHIIEAAATIGTGEVIATCPLCRGVGYDDTTENQLGPGRPNKRGNCLPACRVCKGRKYVYLNKICECGGCAIWYNSEKKVWSCGRNLCVDAAVRRIHGPKVIQQPWSGL